MRLFGSKKTNEDLPTLDESVFLNPDIMVSPRPVQEIKFKEDPKSELDIKWDTIYAKFPKGTEVVYIGKHMVISECNENDNLIAEFWNNDGDLDFHTWDEEDADIILKAFHLLDNPEKI